MAYKNWTKPRNPNLEWYFQNWEKISDEVLTIEKDNQDQYLVFWDKWQKIAGLIVDLYGKDSTQYRYWCRNKPEQPPEIYSRLAKFKVVVYRHHRELVAAEKAAQKRQERKIARQEAERQRWIEEHSVVP